MKKIFKSALLLSVSAFIASCGSNNYAQPLQSLDQMSGFAKKDDNDKGRFFVNNGIANAETQKFLTDSPQADEHPIWSPDGKTIAFQRASKNGGYDIWLMNANGSNQRQLTHCDFDCQQAAWTPDARYIAYRKASGNPNSQGRREFDIAMTEIKTGKEIPLIVYPGDDKHPNFSSDGKYLVFNSERDGLKTNIYTVPLSNIKAKPKMVTSGNNTNDVHPNFSHNGRKILFHSYQLNVAVENEDETPSKIGMVNSNGTGMHWLNTGNLQFPKHPFFTPDENIITFHAHNPADGKRNIYAINLKKAGQITQITDIKNAKHPEISPDGRFLAYSHKRGGQYDISVVEINFNQLRK